MKKILFLSLIAFTTILEASPPGKPADIMKDYDVIVVGCGDVEPAAVINQLFDRSLFVSFEQSKTIEFPIVNTQLDLIKVIDIAQANIRYQVRPLWLPVKANYAALKPDNVSKGFTYQRPIKLC